MCLAACVIPAPLGDGISEYDREGELSECMANPDSPNNPVFNAHGTRCLAECDEGYTASGAEVDATCLDGIWVKSGFCSGRYPAVMRFSTAVYRQLELGQCRPAC